MIWPNPLDVPAGAWLQVVMGSAHSTRIHSVRTDRRHRSADPHILYVGSPTTGVSLQLHLCWPCPSFDVGRCRSVLTWVSSTGFQISGVVCPQFAGLYYIIAFSISKSVSDHADNSAGGRKLHLYTENIQSYYENVFNF